MALEIPPLNGELLSHPDWGPAPTFDRLSLSAGRLLAVLETLPGPEPWLEGLRTLAGTGATVELLLARDRGWVQALVDGRRVTLTGPARAAALALLGETPDSGSSDAKLTDPGSAAAPDRFAPAVAADASAAVRSAAIGAQVQAARALPGGPQPDARPAPAPQTSILPLAIALPLLAGPAAAPAGQVAEQLARAVAASGLFLESHLAQWLRGERTLQQIREEVHSLPPGLRPDDPDAPADRRAGLQLDSLQRQALALSGTAWPDQTMLLQIERDREQHREAANLGDATGVFVATLKLGLPGLGALQARIRVVDNTVGIRIESQQAAALTQQLAPLAGALAARGLHLAQLSATAPGATGS